MPAMYLVFNLSTCQVPERPKQIGNIGVNVSSLKCQQRCKFLNIEHHIEPNGTKWMGDHKLWKENITHKNDRRDWTILFFFNLNLEDWHWLRKKQKICKPTGKHQLKIRTVNYFPMSFKNTIFLWFVILSHDACPGLSALHCLTQ